MNVTRRRGATAFFITLGVCLIALAVTLPAGTASSDVFRHARASGVQIRGIHVRRTSMEDAFLQVIHAADATAGAASRIVPTVQEGASA